MSCLFVSKTDSFIDCIITMISISIYKYIVHRAALQPELGFLSVCGVSSHVHMNFLQVLQFPPASEKICW